MYCTVLSAILLFAILGYSLYIRTSSGVVVMSGYVMCCHNVLFVVLSVIHEHKLT